MSGAETAAVMSARALSLSNQSQGVTTSAGVATKLTPRSGSAMRPTPAPRDDSSSTVRESEDVAPNPNALERQSTGGDLSEQQRTRAEIFEANKDLQDLCRDNGLTCSQFAKRAHAVTVLDTFLGFWPSMKSVMHFPALRELSIVKHPTIVQIDGLDCCPNLEQLTIAECGLTRIENLRACHQLKKLNLSSNKIKSMEPISALEALEELWLNDNRIEKLDGLWGAKKLTTLWICRNRIEQIDSALNGCENLVELNLADNRIFSFKSLLSLANLDHLSVLMLSDPHYGDNPVCRLCNYQTYLMCQLTRLTWLDTIELSTRNKQIAEATMLKKKMYYNMRIKCMKRDVQHRIRRANDVRRNTEQHIELNISALTRHKKEIEQALSDAEGSDLYKTNGVDLQAMRSKLQAIDECLREKCGAIAHMNQDFDAIRSRLQWTADVNISRLMLELETGGNIRLEDGSPSDAWYTSCIDLVKSRLFMADLRPFGISDVRITRVTRINNRYLRNRFHARMEEILVVNEDQVKENVSKKGVTVIARDDDDDESNDLSDGSIEKAAPPGSMPENSLEYLFYAQSPLMEYMRKPEPDQFYAAEYGFRDPSEYRAMGLEGAVKLSNSVSLLETSRLLATFASKSVSMQKRELCAQSIKKYSTLSVQEQESELANEFTREMREAGKLASQGDWDIPGGILLVVKVFPGYTKVLSENESSPSPVDQRDHPGLHSLQAMKPSQLHGNALSDAPQKMYYMFDKSLVLPEYLVEYQYITSRPQAKGMEAVLSQDSDTVAPAKTIVEEHTGLGVAAAMADDFERRYKVRRPASPQVDEDGGNARDPSNGSILDDSVLKLLETGSIGRIASSSESMLPMTRLNLVETGRLKHLYLLGCGMEVMPDLTATKECLEVLVLAYNRIQHIDSSLQALSKLKRLDVSSNRLLKLEHIDRLQSLIDLDASNNQIQAFDDMVGLARNCKLSLRRLNLRKNSICFTKRYRLRMLRAVGESIEMLDEQDVTREEFLASQRLLTELSPAVLWTRYRSSRGGVVTETSQSVTANAEHGSKSGEHDERQCWTAVEELVLTRELISAIEGFDLFTNLRILSFADNVVRRIDGLQQCTRLEELNLEDNEITKVENLSSLASLKRLNLARNRLTSIDQLESLENLTQLSLEDNLITSLRGLASAMKLMELYIGNNRIENLKEVQYLKALPKLTILDLSGNEITRLPDYRLYTVYYLRRVKVLDGVSVSPQDQSEAKQKYSGKLNLEFIAEKCGSTNFERLQELDLSSCRIRELGSISGKTFPNLRDLNFENNQISDISGLESLPKLRVLNLNRNRIERLLLSSNATGGSLPEGAEGKGVLSCTKLEQLFLAYNQINDMTALGLQHLDTLRVLHLQGNAIVFFAGLDSNIELLELRLDKNKIRQLDPHSTTALRRLRVLSLDDNGLRTLSNFNELMSIEFLDLSNNRLSELEEIDKLTSVLTIVELRLLNNPLVKKHMYRHTALYKLNTLRSLDGREVTAEERERVEVLFLHERAAAMMNQTTDRPPNNPTTQFSLTPSSVPGKHGMQASTAGSQMIMTANRNLVSQLNSGDVLAGSLLRKNPISPAGFSPNQQPVQSVSTFPKSVQPADATIAIAPGNTTTKSLLNNTSNMASFRSYSVSNQAGSSNIASLAPSITLNSSSPTVTVASAFNASLSNTGSDQLNLGALRFDRRRMNSIHYDPALTAYPQAGPVGMVTGAGSLGGGVISTNAILRAPLNVPSPHCAIIHPLPLSVDMTFSKGATASFPTGVPADSSTRSFSGYVVSVGNQKRYGSVQERTNAADLAVALASSARSGLAKPR